MVAPRRVAGQRRWRSCPAGTWATLPSRSTFPVTEMLPGSVIRAGVALLHLTPLRRLEVHLHL